MLEALAIVRRGESDVVNAESAVVLSSRTGNMQRSSGRTGDVRFFCAGVAGASARTPATLCTILCVGVVGGRAGVVKPARGTDMPRGGNLLETDKLHSH